VVQQSTCAPKAFTNPNKDRQSTVYAAKYSTKSIGAGEVILHARLNKHEKNPVKLKDTLCVPGLRNNLLSVAKITDNGYTVTFRKHHAMVNRSDGSVTLTEIKCNDLYIVNNGQEQAILTSEKRDKDLMKWHQRYGHLNVSDLKNMKNNDIVFGIKFAPQTSEINCKTCVKYT